MNYVSIKYFQTALDAYAGRAYTYATELPLNVGDKVLCPTVNAEDNKAIVVAVGLEKPIFDCKVITKMDTE